MVRIMPSIETEDHNPGVFDRSLFKCVSNNYSYEKLPQHLIKLSVLKLDGSSFDVFVARNATVVELRQAVEGVFRLPPEDGQANISWSHVWGHFCLCHEEHKLLDDGVQITNLGIKDCDQLKFIQHMSINYSPAKQQSKKTGDISRRFSMPSLLKSTCVKGKQTSINDNTNIVEDDFNPRLCDNEDEIQVPRFKLPHSLNGRLAYTKLNTSTRK